MRRNVLIHPRDPVIFRDGRPFSAGLGARSIPWPLPSTIAGFLRTRLWGSRPFTSDVFTAEEKARLLAVRHEGPFMACLPEEGDWELAFPAPADAALYEKSGGAIELTPLRPVHHLPDGSGSDLPEGLNPVGGGKAQKEAAQAPPFWTAAQTLAWLARADSASRTIMASDLGYERLPEQTRLHTQIHPQRRNVVEHMLFRTIGLEFDGDGAFRKAAVRTKGRERLRRRCAIFSRLAAADDDWASTDGMGSLGGEQRVASFASTTDLLPAKPAENPGSLVRVQLVTPGAFDDGWKPNWTETGEPPGCPGLRLRLIAAAVRGSVAISGFDMTRKGDQRLRPTRLLAPAGSVYFFEVKQGDPRDLWLKSISDKEQDRNDGFGVVLTGVWQWQ